MPYYAYKAVDEKGLVRKGRLHAHNAFEMERRLETMEQDLIHFKEIDPNKFSFSRKGVSRKDMINFTFQMEQLTRSGVPLLEGLKDLRDALEISSFKDILTNVVEAIEGGKKFSEALAEYPLVFDNIFVALVAIGEDSGELPRVLKDLAESLKWMDELISHTKKIMVYPMIVGSVVLGVVTFLMIYLVPQLVPFIKDMGGELPLQTKLLIWTSEAFVEYWYYIFGAPIVFLIVLKFLVRSSPSLQLKIDALKLKIPLFGAVLFKIKLARFASYFALMYASGVTVLDILKVCGDLMDNKMLEQGVDMARENIANGSTISLGFEEVEMFPKLVIRMLKVGEDTGNLEEALQNVSYFYDREVQDAIDRLEPAMEPIMTVAMGGIMAWIMVAVLGPVYDIISTI